MEQLAFPVEGAGRVICMHELGIGQVNKLAQDNYSTRADQDGIVPVYPAQEGVYTISIVISHETQRNNPSTRSMKRYDTDPADS